MASGEIKKLVYRATALVPAGGLLERPFGELCRVHRPSHLYLANGGGHGTGHFHCQRYGRSVVATFDVSMGGDSCGIDDFVLE